MYPRSKKDNLKLDRRIYRCSEATQEHEQSNLKQTSEYSNRTYSFQLIEMTGTVRKPFDMYTCQKHFGKRYIGLKTTSRDFFSTLVSENSRPRAKRRNTTPN
jgi:hypothetical protein